ncbi:MAG: threonine--tRNA ligase [archaeon]
MDGKLEKIRHSTSHILAYAVKLLYSKAKLGIGPAIEDGFYYDFGNVSFTPEDLKKIETKMDELIDQNLVFKKIDVTKQKAQKMLKDEPYKLDLLKELKGKITLYQCGNFYDLCKGPHVKSTKEIKAYKLLTIAGSYWRGDSKNPMLQRIYGTAFGSKEDLDAYLKNREEAEKRNHIRLGKELNLFSMHEEGPGFPFFHPRGMIIRNELINFWRQEHKKEGYIEISTPMILSRRLWEKSGHWDHYKDNMYFTKIDNQDYAVKPMNCPGSILIYNTGLHSYREFPLRMAELGLVHRHELSGVLNGLFRVRAFTQDDAHIYCMEEQIKDEVIRVINLADRMYKIFKLPYHLELSTRPKKSIGTAEMWKTAEDALKAALKDTGIKFKVNAGDGAFYGPKIDFHIEDSLGRTWQCATIQLDFAMPEKFDLTYEGKDGKKHRPVMIHRTILGSIERFIAILLEHYAGKLPLWLAPMQVRILTVTDRSVKYANEVKAELEANGVRVEIDDRPETIGKKVRDAQIRKVNYMVTVGDKEVDSRNLAIRTLDGKVTHDVKIYTFVNDLLSEIHEHASSSPK